MGEKKKRLIITFFILHRSEAVSLVLRMNDAGWIHGSVAKRNILMKPGPLSDIPLERHLNSDARDGHGVNWDFRLIDFGRAFEILDPGPNESDLHYWLTEEKRDIRRLLTCDHWTDVASNSLDFFALT